MAESEKRLRYYRGQFLQEEDFTDEQQYHLDRQRRHNRQLHSHGIAEGLKVTANVGAASVTVAPGTAIDGEGRTIVLSEIRSLAFESLVNQWVLVVIAYKEELSDPSTTGDEKETRWLERPDVKVIAEAGAPAADFHIRLARLQITDGKVSQHDTTVRTSAGKLGPGSLKAPNVLGTLPQPVQDQNDNRSSLAIGTESVEISTDVERAPVLKVTGSVTTAPIVELRSKKNESSIRYVTEDVKGVPWHVGTGGNGMENFFFWNEKQKVVATISPEGTLTTKGLVVNGRNLAADGPRLDALASATLEGVSNPGGNIDLVGKAGITVTGNNNDKTITIQNASGSLAVPVPLNPVPQPVHDQADKQSALKIGSESVEIITEVERAHVFTVTGSVTAAPIVELRSKKNESSIRYVTEDQDGVPWHAGTGGNGGLANFFFWNHTNGVVARMTPDGTFSLNGGLEVKKTKQPTAGHNGLRTLMIDPATGQVYNTDSPQRFVVRSSFTQADPTDTIKTITVGFQPKLISMEGRAHARLTGDLAYGGAVGGFCRCFENKTLYAAGHGPHISRLNSAPYVNFYNHMHEGPASNALGNVVFRDTSTTPNLHVSLEIIVESITTDGFRLKWVRTTESEKSAPSIFGLDLLFAVLG